MTSTHIAGHETFVVATPPPHKGGRYFMFVKLVTEGGSVGWGEVYCASFAPAVVVAMIDDVCRRHVLGADPHHVETLWRTVYARGYGMRPDPTLVAVLSGIEIACWDLIGQAAGQPIHQLLGGRIHDRLRTYTYLYPSAETVDLYAHGDVYSDPGLAAARAVDYVDQGFTGLKLDPMGGYSVFDPRQPSLERLDLAEAMVAALRDAVGTRADLLLGTHGQFTASGAIRLARRLERYEPLWFEEPTPPDMPEEMARVAAGTTIPVATGERLTTRYEFARVLALGAASIVQPALGRAGGLLEGKKIAAIAEAHYAQLAPHLYAGPILAAANAQLAACTPNFLILETIEDLGGFHAELLVEPLEWADGHLTVPTGPGLGAAIDETVALANPYTGDALHLEMTDHPL